MQNLNFVMEDELPGPGRNVIMHPLYLPKMSSWLDLKVFYVRVSNCKVDESSPDHLTLNHIPLTPDTVLEVNGRRSSICVSSLLRRDRVDKRSEEVTYVSTDSISITGSIIFEVCDRDDLLLSGVLELSDDNGVIGEQRSSSSKRWKMECHSLMSGGSTCFLKDKLYMSSETILPTVEVYVAGCFSGIPIIMTKTLKLGIQKKQQRTVVLDSIPEYETAEHKKQVSPKYTSQSPDYEDLKPERDVDVDYNSIYPRSEYAEWEEDGELSWFNAGVRVGVGLGLGICLGVGVGVGLLVRTYQTTTRTFKRRFI